jgi:hypothetical protein
MKTTSKLLIGIALAGSLFAGCAGTYYVRERPNEPVYSRPAAPYANAIWVPGEWEWRGGRYEYVQGYWARPRGTRVYVQGSWETGPRGYVWHRGHWR